MQLGTTETHFVESKNLRRFVVDVSRSRHLVVDTILVDIDIFTGLLSIMRTMCFTIAASIWCVLCARILAIV